MATRNNGTQFSGTCKFWNAVKGFGFISADDGGADLFVSQHDLVTGDSGFRALTAGQRVECTYTIVDNGKAIGKNVTGPGGASLKSFKDMYTAKREIETAKPPDPNKLYGTIKWFNAGKSFGFIIPQTGGEDIFFHYSECLKGIVPAEGDSVEYAVQEDKSGKTVGSKIKNKTQKKSSSNPNMAGAMGGFPAQVAMGYPGAGAYPPAFAAGGFAGGRKTGVVKFFDEGKGYGFIIPDNGGRDIHVHKSNVMGGELAKDDAVEFEESLQSGKMQAVSVSRAPAGGKRSGGAPPADPYATKRPRVVYEIPAQAAGAQASPYGGEYQYFDASSMGGGAPRYY